MKCEVCQGHLEEYLDGELEAVEQEEISAHLITCADCSACFSTLTAEQELFSRYDREVEVPPFLWTRVAQQTVAANGSVRLGWRERIASLFTVPSFAAALAILLIAIAVGALYLRKPDSTLSRNGTDPAQANAEARPDMTQAGTNEVQSSKAVTTQDNQKRQLLASTRRVIRKVKPRATLGESDVLSSDLGYLDIYDRDTAKHIEQTQNLLRSIRNVAVSDGDEEIDVTYDKALSRRLLNENVVLRRDAEMKAKFPTKSLLADVEPFLIEIANLPDHARPEDVRVIKERVQKTEIVAALMGFQDRTTNNR